MRLHRRCAGIVLAFVAVLAAVLSALSDEQLVRPALAQATTVIVRGVLADGTVVVPRYATLVKRKPDGTPDNSSGLLAIRNEQNQLLFLGVGVGSYLLEIVPESQTIVPLRNYPVEVSGAVSPLDLGDILFQRLSKLIRGSITRDGQPFATNATVSAYNSASDAYYSTRAVNGAYELSVREGGDWLVEVQTGDDDPWMFTDRPSTVRLADDTSAETVTVNLNVKSTVGKLLGRLVAPDGAPLPLPPALISQTLNYSAGITVYGDASYYARSVSLKPDARFAIPLVAGRFAGSIYLDPEAYPDYSAPAIPAFDIVGGDVNLGDIQLQRRNAIIQGRVTDPSGTPVANMPVRAFGTTRSSVGVTDTNGNYQLRVAPGKWSVNAEPPEGSLYSAYNSWRDVEVADGASASADIQLAVVAARVSGSVVDAANPATLLTDVKGWAYARDPVSNRHVASSGINAGRFSLALPEGNYLVGVELDINSSYSFLDEVAPTQRVAGAAQNADLAPAARAALERRPYEQAISITGGPAPQQTPRSVTIRLVRNSATINGQLVDQRGQPLTGIKGYVYASPANKPAPAQRTRLGPDGRYAIGVAPGNWLLNYSLQSDDIAPYGQRSISITVSANSTETRNLIAATLDGFVVGRVIDDADQPVAGASVWVIGNSITRYTQSSTSGEFSVNVPLNEGDQPAVYRVGTAFSCQAGQICYLNVDPKTVTANPRSSLGLQQLYFVELRARRSNKNIKISGRLQDKDGNAGNIQVTLEPRGLNAQSGRTNTQGRYELNIAASGAISTLKYRFKAKGQSFNKVAKIEKSGDLRISSLLQQDNLDTVPDLELAEVASMPRSVTEVFTITEGWSSTLDDGTSITIPPGAVQAPAGQQTQVRVVVEPTPFLLPTNLYEEAVYYGYTIRLEDLATNQELSTPLVEPALLTIRYDDATLRNNGAAPDTVAAARLVGDYWLPTSAIVNTAARRVTVQTSYLGTWALVNERFNSSIYLSLVRK